MMVRKILDVPGSLHGYGIAPPVELISGKILFGNHGIFYPVLLRLEQTAAIIARFFEGEAEALA